jgi:Ca2+-binding EF-hand superfamily protein
MIGSIYRAEAQEPGKEKMDTKYLLEKNDRNGDGKLSIEEFPENKRDHFKTIDTDGDGFMTQQEEKVYRKGSPEERDREKEKKKPEQSPRFTLRKAQAMA